MKSNATNSGRLDIRRVPIADVSNWDKNPRGIKTADFERLKKQILELGVYKPLIVYPDGKGFIVIGGNMRLRALKDMGVKDVDVSVVHPKTESDKIKIALSDNDRAGFYDDQVLTELVLPYRADIDLTGYKVDLGEAMNLEKLIGGFAPDINDPKPQAEPHLDSECFVEIYCSKSDLQEFRKTLDKWAERNGVTVNVS